MKYLKNVFTLMLVASLVIFMNCGTVEPKPDPIGKVVAEKLAQGAWGTTVGGVTLDNTPREEWDNFSVTFTTNDDYTGGNYSTSGVPTEDGASRVWGAGGTWAFEDNNGIPNLTKIIRDDNVELSVNVDVNDTGDAGSLTLSFPIPEEGARVAGFDGNWVFAFELN